MLLQTLKLKRDYKVKYTLLTSKDDITDGIVYTAIIKDCYTQHQAYERWYDTIEYASDLIDIEAIVKTKQQRINDEVYELVLAELFDGQIAVYEYIDTNEEDYELDTELEGIEKIMIEHEAYNRYMNTRCK